MPGQIFPNACPPSVLVLESLPNETGEKFNPHPTPRTCSNGDSNKLDCQLTIRLIIPRDRHHEFSGWKRETKAAA